MIKLIYSKNGTGKTFYAKERSDLFSVNSRFIQYRLKDNDLKYSEYFKIEEIALDTITKLEKKVLSNKSSIMSGKQPFNITEFKELMKSQNFIKYEDWKNGVDDEQSLNFTISKGVKLYGFISDNKSKFDSVTDKQLESLILYKQLEKVTYQPVNIIEEMTDLFDKIKELKSLLTSETDSIFEELKSLSDKDLIYLKGVWKNNGDINQKIINSLKMFIINSDEYKEMQKIENKMLTDQQSAMIFKKDSEYVKDDGKSIVLKEGRSDGEVVVDVMLAVVESINHKGILLDDVFEKLDEENQVKLIYELSTIDKEVIILTHSSYTRSIIKESLNQIGVSWAEYDLIYDGSGATPTAETKIADEKNTTWKELIEKLIPYEKYDNKRFSDLLLFTKIFARLEQKSGSISDMSRIKLMDSWGKQYFDASSQYAFHYTSNIDVKKLNYIYKSDFSGEKIDSIGFIEQLITKFSAHTGDMFGISFKRVVDFLKETKMFLEIEKKINITDPRGASEKHNKWLLRVWPDGKTLAGCTRKERGEHMHILDNSLAKIIKETI